MPNGCGACCSTSCRCWDDRPAFEKLGLEFAQSCETSPPTWREAAPVSVATVSNEPTVVLQGVLTGGDAPDFVKLRQALARKQAFHIDFGKLASCDDEAAGVLSELLHGARQHKLGITLDGADGFLGRLEKRLVVGLPEHLAAWLLVLELYQSLDCQQQFEDKAVDYAITFEVSPPSWETIAGTQEGAAQAGRVAQPGGRWGDPLPVR